MLMDYVSDSGREYGVLPVQTDMIMAPGGGGGGFFDGFFDDFSSDYGWYDAGGGYDGGGSNLDSDAPSTVAPAQSASVHLDNSHATFNGQTSDGKTGNQTVTPALASTFTSVVNSATMVTSVNVSATTNGHADQAPNSDHNSGVAVDVNIINGVHVSSSGDGMMLASNLEATAMNNPNVRYVEGPMGNFVRDTPGANWRPSANLPGMTNHVHFSVFK